jgi:predicted amidophosphoribosyltransferase
MTTSESSKVGSHASVQRGVLCAKCEHLCPPGSNVCDECGAHLHVKCHACGQRNPRVAARCAECGQRLHRSFWERRLKKLKPKRMKITLLQLALAVLAAFGTYKIIVKLLNGRIIN